MLPLPSTRTYSYRPRFVLIASERDFVCVVYFCLLVYSDVEEIVDDDA